MVSTFLINLDGELDLMDKDRSYGRLILFSLDGGGRNFCGGLPRAPSRPPGLAQLVVHVDFDPYSGSISLGHARLDGLDDGHDDPVNADGSRGSPAEGQEEKP